MKRILTTIATTLSALTMAATIAAPANAATGSVTLPDPANDQQRGSEWFSASGNAQKASDLLSANVRNNGSTVTVTWTLGSVLPSTNTSYMQQVGLTGFLSGQPLTFFVTYNGTSAKVTYNNTSPQCVGQISSNVNTTANTITIAAPLGCLPNGQNLSSIYASADVYRGNLLVGTDITQGNDYSVPWKG